MLLFKTTLSFYSVSVNAEQKFSSQWLKGGLLRSPRRHIPIDTSLCTDSPQVRIYGFVAAGIPALRHSYTNSTFHWTPKIISTALRNANVESFSSCTSFKTV